ncbi:MAG: hypothetical protein AAGU11_20540 [Syntrophobacteraceae bacterium]
MHDIEHRATEPESAPPIPELEKLKKMAEHWMRHNEEHAGNYLAWADRARRAGREEPAVILEEIAKEAVEQNTKLQKILELLAASPE